MHSRSSSCSGAAGFVSSGNGPVGTRLSAAYSGAGSGDGADAGGSFGMESTPAAVSRIREYFLIIRISKSSDIFSLQY
jgi:hypothetical protein